MRSALLLVSALLASCSGGAGKSNSSAADLACDVATAYADTLLLKQRGQKVVFSDTPEQLPESFAGIGWNEPQGGGPGAQPSTGLLASLKAAPSISAVKACASLRSHLESKGIAYGTKAVEEATRVQMDGKFHATVLGISFPAVSADGTEAVLASSGVAAPEAGSGFLQYLKREPTGAWVVVSWAGVWIA